jgi:tRNA-binding protein
VPTADDFFAIDIRVGTVVAAEPFPEARKPAYRLTVDFGPATGTKRSSAQLTHRYTPDALIGRQVIGVVNIGTRRIAGFSSECLILGACPDDVDVVLLAPDHPIPNGTRIG